MTPTGPLADQTGYHRVASQTSFSFSPTDPVIIRSGASHFLNVDIKSGLCSHHLVILKAFNNTTSSDPDYMLVNQVYHISQYRKVGEYITTDRELVAEAARFATQKADTLGKGSLRKEESAVIIIEYKLSEMKSPFLGGPVLAGLTTTVSRPVSGVHRSLTDVPRPFATPRRPLFRATWLLSEPRPTLTLGYFVGLRTW